MIAYSLMVALAASAPSAQYPDGLLRCSAANSIGAGADGTLSKVAVDDIWLKHYRSFTADLHTGIVRFADTPKPENWSVISRARYETILTPSERLLDILTTSIVFVEPPGKPIASKVHHFYRLIVGTCIRID